MVTFYKTYDNQNNNYNNYDNERKKNTVKSYNDNSKKFIIPRSKLIAITLQDPFPMPRI